MYARANLTLLKEHMSEGTFCRIAVKFYFILPFNAITKQITDLQKGTLRYDKPWDNLP